MTYIARFLHRWCRSSVEDSRSSGFRKPEPSGVRAPCWPAVEVENSRSSGLSGVGDGKKGPRRGASGGAGEGACTAARPAVLHRLHLRAGAVAAGRRRRWARGASGGVGDSSRDTTGKPTGDRVVAARLGFGVGWAPLCGATGVRVGFVGCLGCKYKCAMSKHIWAGLYFG